MRRAPGSFQTSNVGGEPVRAYLPPSLPPDPPLVLEPVDERLLEEAALALGRLDGLTAVLPDTGLFIYFYVRKEAVLSSQIEGTQSSLSDLLLYEHQERVGVPLDDVQEVSSYVAAMYHGLRRLRGDGFPLSGRLLREMHGVLLSKGRGSDTLPGEFRRSQNWVGGTRPGNATYVPPPWERVPELISHLERFLHDDSAGRSRTLVKAALAHVQFESIHPFLDGNGRLGRLLITLLLCAEGILQEPTLYLSLYFKEHRDEYYELLQRVRAEGDWEQWIRFFARGVKETAEQAVTTARRVLDLFDRDRRTIEGFGGTAGSAVRIHEALKRSPVGSGPFYARQTSLSSPTVNKVLTALETAGIVREITGRKRERVFAYDPYLQLLAAGTEPLPVVS